MYEIVYQTNQFNLSYFLQPLILIKLIIKNIIISIFIMKIIIIITTANIINISFKIIIVTLTSCIFIFN
jgi:hypothetical protein